MGDGGTRPGAAQDGKHGKDERLVNGFRLKVGLRACVYSGLCLGVCIKLRTTRDVCVTRE